MKPAYTFLLILFLFAVSAVFLVLGNNQRSQRPSGNLGTSLSDAFPQTFCSSESSSICLLQYSFSGTLQGRELTVGGTSYDIAPADDVEYGLLTDTIRVFTTLKVTYNEASFFSPLHYGEAVNESNSAPRCVTGVLEHYRKVEQQLEVETRRYASGEGVIRLRECESDTPKTLTLENQTILDILGATL